MLTGGVDNGCALVTMMSEFSNVGQRLIYGCVRTLVNQPVAEECGGGVVL